MYYNHPYDGWAEAGQNQVAPSVLGALPYPSTPSPPTLITYHMTAFAPTVLNSKVADSQGRVHFIITTDDEMPGYTVIKNSQNNSVALVEWKSPPFIEIRGLLSKQNVKSWLALSPDRRYDILSILHQGLR